MDYTIRSCDYEDMPHVVSMLNRSGSKSVDLEVFRRQIAHDDQAGPTTYYVVVDGTESVVGFGRCFPDQLASKSGYFNLRITSSTHERHRGIGTLLYRQLDAWLTQNHAIHVNTNIRDNDDASLSFATNRGFQVAHHAFESRLDLSAWQPESFSATLEQVNRRGVRLANLRELGGTTDENMQNFYVLEMKLLEDEPVSSGGTLPEFGVWKQEILEQRGLFEPEGMWFALHDEVWVASASLYGRPDNTVYNGGTVVDRAYRGQSIAFALKIASLRWAKSAGFTYAVTNNEATNTSIIALNQRLGYQPSPGFYMLEKWL
ncbi:GNAT family N-acetyltransferase [Alicyclobacillus ferrooxydans]|nr:GNAT family N-acetyltransferase [Alicyclobacillus ferrooxydans]